MIKVEALIRPSRLERVKNALDDIGIHGITVTSVLGAGKQRGHTQYYRAKELAVNLLEKCKVETVVPDELVDDAINAITKAASTGEIGDGKIFLSRVEDAIRIRTGERGEGVL
ncbi:MAG: P-II family nitrogen regulator [Armatimonadota bacterium]|nr:P-II family nitrogen regulator [Armatimonadota bacterium]